LRKQLLLAESELNRAQLERQLLALRQAAHSLRHEAGLITRVASTTAMVVAFVASLRGPHTPSAPEKPSWGRKLLKGVGLVSTLWTVFRSPPKD
jgi:hypothetical protein